MTNKDKFLKKETNIDEFTFKFDEWHIKNSDIKGYGEALFRFLQEETKPTLTEDERVILRNIDKNFKYIARVNKQIQVCTVKTSNRGLPCDSGYLFTFNHLFQFIKEGEEYEIAELLGDEKNDSF